MTESETEATTELLPRARAADPEPAAAPVFVDASGRRRRVAHRLAVGAFLAAAGYSLMVIWSLLGGPVSPDSLMPFSAPHPATSTARPTESAQPSATALAGTRNSSSTSGAGITDSAQTDASRAATTASSTASVSASASTAGNGHRPTTAPGKSTASPTNGHGH